LDIAYYSVFSYASHYTMASIPGGPGSSTHLQDLLEFVYKTPSTRPTNCRPGPPFFKTEQRASYRDHVASVSPVLSPSSFISVGFPAKYEPFSVYDLLFYKLSMLRTSNRCRHCRLYWLWWLSNDFDFFTAAWQCSCELYWSHCCAI